MLNMINILTIVRKKTLATKQNYKKSNYSSKFFRKLMPLSIFVKFIAGNQQRNMLKVCCYIYRKEKNHIKI